MEKVMEDIKELENKYHRDFISNLNKRGWTVYSTNNPGGFAMTNLDELEEIVSQGSEKKGLIQEMAYQVLPYVEDDASWPAVKEAMMYALANHRFPFFVDLMTVETEDESEDDGVREETKAIGVYLIDSVVYTRPTYELIIDYQLMDQLGIVAENNGNIILNVDESYKILKQLTLARRN